MSWSFINGIFAFKHILILKETQYFMPNFQYKSEKLSSGHRTGKGQFSFQSQRKNVPTIAHLQSSHTLAK